MFPSNGKRKICLADQYCCTPIFTTKLTSRIFFDKKKAIKNLLTWKRSLISSQAQNKTKKIEDVLSMYFKVTTKRNSLTLPCLQQV